VNLRNKKYHIFNEAYSKEEYEKQVKDLAPISLKRIQETRDRAHGFWRRFPQKYMHERHNSNVSGDYIDNSKNTRDTFIAHAIEDSRFCSFISPGNVKDSYDFTHYGSTAELVYDSLQVGDQASRVLFNWFAVSNVRNTEYSMFVVGCRDVFGSVSLKKREYCILNKQYSRQEYEKLRDRIIKDVTSHPYKDSRGNAHPYGEFFPIEMSPFGYNATTAQEFFPLTRDQAIQRDYRWKEQEKNEYSVTRQPEDVPDSAAEMSDAFSDEVIGCEHRGRCNEQCSTAFKVVPNEIAFYRQMNLPIPRLCPSCRHYNRLAFRNPMKLWHRKCLCAGAKSENDIYANATKHFHGSDHCPNEFETSYAPDRPEIVYCEQCYQSEVV